MKTHDIESIQESHALVLIELLIAIVKIIEN